MPWILSWNYYVTFATFSWRNLFVLFVQFLPRGPLSFIFSFCLRCFLVSVYVLWPTIFKAILYFQVVIDLAIQWIQTVKYVWNASWVNFTECVKHIYDNLQVWKYFITHLHRNWANNWSVIFLFSKPAFARARNGKYLERFWYFSKWFL